MTKRGESVFGAGFPRMRGSSGTQGTEPRRKEEDRSISAEGTRPKNGAGNPGRTEGPGVSSGRVGRLGILLPRLSPGLGTSPSARRPRFRLGRKKPNAPAGRAAGRRHPVRRPQPQGLFAPGGFVHRIPPGGSGERKGPPVAPDQRDERGENVRRRFRLDDHRGRKRMENRPVFYPKLSSSSLNRGRPRRGSRLLSCSYQAFWVIRPTPIDFSRQDMASS